MHGLRAITFVNLKRTEKFFACNWSYVIVDAFCLAMHVGGSDEKVCILQGSAATFSGAVDKFTILRAKKCLQASTCQKS